MNDPEEIPIRAAHSRCPFPRHYPSELRRDDTYYMWLAYNQAIEAWNKDEVPIGAIIECEGQVIATGFNQVESLKDPTAHAEILAITSAAAEIGDWRLNKATLYVTKEPCPMCSGAAIMSRLKRVVFALPDPKMGCMGGATAVHQIPTLNHSVEVVGGILQTECHALLQAYFKMKRSEMQD